MAPIIMASNGEIISAEAVIPTNPASAPFNVFAKSGRLFITQELPIAAICIIDDHEIIRTGIKKLIHNTNKYDVVYEFESNKNLLNQTLNKNIDLIIQDLDLENGCNIAELDLLNYKYPNVPILIYTMHPESIYGLACLKYEVSGYLTKDKPVRMLLTAIETICKGDNYFTPEITKILTNQYLNKNCKKTETLSKREHEVYILIGEGLSQTEIAKKLFIHKKTVSTFRRRILDKLELSTTSQIIHYYLSEKNTQSNDKKESLMAD